MEKVKIMKFPLVYYFINNSFLRLIGNKCLSTYSKIFLDEPPVVPENITKNFAMSVEGTNNTENITLPFDGVYIVR